MNFTDKFLNSCMAAKAAGMNSINSVITLRVLSRAKDGTAMSYIGNLIGISGSAMTGIVDKLEEMGLVERRHDPKDRRTTRIIITQRGRDCIKTITGEP
jgi:DNA-binding MarR family transcriptional regulator